MKKCTCLFLGLVLFASCSGVDQPESGDLTTVVLVRHAEKMDDSEDPDLSEEGYRRADRLSEMLSRLQFDAVYSTPRVRTQKTVEAIAERNDTVIEDYDHEQLDTLIPAWLNRHRGETILISGHSNTTPPASNLALGREHFEGKFDESDFGNIIIITRSQNGESKLLHLRY
ncbi:MAG: histidine phosphatase family protein [Balneolaceae bacterium]